MKTLSLCFRRTKFPCSLFVSSNSTLADGPRKFLAAPPLGGPFQFVFDRGCFHVFDEPGERKRFAENVAAALAPGLWRSLIGSTEGSAREVGPPRRSACQVTLAIEPALEIIELQSAEFRGHGAKAWLCLSRQRTVLAQPSTRRD